MGEFTAGTVSAYSLNKEGNGIYVFLLEGQVEINGLKMSIRDGLGITEVDSIDISSITDSKVLVMEVPMQNL